MSRIDTTFLYYDEYVKYVLQNPEALAHPMHFSSFLKMNDNKPTPKIALKNIQNEEFVNSYPKYTKKYNITEKIIKFIKNIFFDKNFINIYFYHDYTSFKEHKNLLNEHFIPGISDEIIAFLGYDTELYTIAKIFSKYCIQCVHEVYDEIVHFQNMRRINHYFTFKRLIKLV